MISLNITNLNNISSLTLDARADHPSGSCLHNQAWSWDGGDAVVTVVGHLSYVSTWITLRLGEAVHTVEARGLVQALAELGHEAQA